MATLFSLYKITDGIPRCTGRGVYLKLVGERMRKEYTRDTSKCNGKVSNW